jgi:hypothetical protein
VGTLPWPAVVVHAVVTALLTGVCISVGQQKNFVEARPQHDSEAQI